MISASSARAAMRPMVEKRAEGGRLSFARAPSTAALTSGFPAAYASSVLARGPTSIGVSWYRGNFTQEYFSSVFRKS